jgi:L-fucose isomerase-like protein
MNMPVIRAGFVGFGEVNSPRDLIEAKVAAARQALLDRGLELVDTPPVSDDPERRDEMRALRDLCGMKRPGFGDLGSPDRPYTLDAPFDVLVLCVAGWIPSHTVIDLAAHFAHVPMVLWGLTGHVQGGRLVTTADQAGTSALRDPMEALGFRFKYVYDTIDAPLAGADKVVRFARAAQAAARLRHAKIGYMGYRDMTLYATVIDPISLRRVIGPDIEVFEMLETVQGMEGLDPAEVARVVGEIRSEWRFEKPVGDAALEKGVRMYLAVMEKVRERGYEAVSLMDVDGVKKLLHFPPAMPLLLLADKGGVASIPENDGLGSVTQLIVRYLTGQVGAYMEFYEFMADRLLLGVPDYVPSEVVDGGPRVLGTTTVLPWPGFGGLKDGILNISKLKTGPMTLCRLGCRGDRYWMHIVTGRAVAPRPWEEAGWEPPAPQLPSVEFIPDTPVEDFAQKVLAQHYIIAYGDQRAALEDLCRLLRIDVV